MLKRILSVVACCLIFWMPAEAALGTLTQWDVRTGGADTNGGGFDAGCSSPGTDFSTQNAAQVAYTDLVIGATTTQVTSVLHPFNSTFPCNLIQIISGTGCTAGFFLVASVSGIIATLDRSAGTAASACTANLGGGLLTIAKALAVVVDASGQNFNTVWTQAGTYTITATLSVTKGSRLYGYQTTHGDNGTKPLVTTATNSTITLNINTISPNSIVNMSFSNTAGTRAQGIRIQSSSQPVLLQSVVLDGHNIGVQITTTTGIILQQTEIKNAVSQGISVNVGATVFVAINGGSWIHSNGTNGIDTAGGAALNLTIDRSYITSNTSHGVSVTSNGDVINILDSALSLNGGDGCKATGTNPTGYVVNSIIWGNTGTGLNWTNASFPAGQFAFNSAFGGNGTNTTNFQNVNGITLTSSPFTSATNFALNATAGGGALLKATGFPGAFAGGLTTAGTPDVGPAQSACATAKPTALGCKIQ